MTKDPLSGLSLEKQQFIREAVAALEFPQPLARISQMIGQPIERTVQMLPASVQSLVFSATEKALEGALGASLATVPEPRIQTESFEAMIARADANANQHRLGTIASGAVGGFFGAWGLVFELPVTTGVMLRSIATIAQSFGEDLSTVDSKLECMKVFAFGSPHPSDTSTDTSYYGARLLLRRFVTEASQVFLQRTVRDMARSLETRTAPFIGSLVVKIASRFEVAVSQKAVAQFLPGLGAGAGALINAAFAKHFNLVSKYHFGLRALEREHGEEAIEAAYSQIFRETVSLRNKDKRAQPERAKRNSRDSLSLKKEGLPS